MPAVSRRTKKIAVAVIITAPLFVGICLYGYFDPEQSRWFPKCLFLTLTGWKCPGCGSQRALHQLLHGHIAAAFHYNALLICAIPLVAFLFSAEWLRDRCPRYYRVSRNPVFSWGIVVVTLLWWVLRNLYGW